MAQAQMDRLTVGCFSHTRKKSLKYPIDVFLPFVREEVRKTRSKSNNKQRRLFLFQMTVMAGVEMAYLFRRRRTLQ